MADNFTKESLASNFKFKSLKVYSSTEWLADNKKKYRKVFEKSETSYVYAELAFHNKLFDEKDWDVNIELKCFVLKKGKKEVCSLPFRRTVSKYDPVMFIREGWGNKKKGMFWKKGTYFWEAWIEGKKVATKYFYIEDARNNLKSDENPYVDIESIKLYEGPYDDILAEERTYLSEFSSDETRYVYTEIILKNKNINTNWQCEIFIKFKNNVHELKGQVIRLQRVEKGDSKIRITAGWGSNIKGSWREGSYSIDLVFMDRLLAYVPLNVGQNIIEGYPQIIIPSKEGDMQVSSNNIDSRSFEDVLSDLDAMIGLNEIKQQVRDHAQYIRFLQLRKNKGFTESEELNIHSVFSGNPGTGKTTVARMMGKLYHKMGLLSKGHVHEVDRVDLVGEYIGQTAPKVKEAIDKARGGILFIDEAYALARSNDDTKDFGREVIEILMKEMSNGEGDLAVIAAGYPDEMNYFLESNPGLKSRFKQVYDFSDYLPKELTEISYYAAEIKKIHLTESAQNKLNEYIIDAFRNRNKTFGNARFVFDILEKAKINLALRIMKDDNTSDLTKEELEIVTLDDVLNIGYKKPKELPNLPIDEALLKESMTELDDLIGLKSIKEEIKETVALVRYFKDTGKNVLNSFFLHTVFLGNPGTGKTTVARILTKIYKALGILERGHMVETDRQGLVAGFVGQTAIKTAQKIDESIGGVLFIDEAYALNTGGGGVAHSDFGNEAIQTILKRMEDQRGEFFLFVAGYTDNMETFLKMNPGFSSRFDKTLKFEDYSPEELLEIGISMLADKELNMSNKALEHLKKYMHFIHEMRDKYFGNARNVRSLIEDIVKKHNLRLSSMEKNNRTETEVQTISHKDVAFLELDKDKLTFNKKTIGFKK